jgi:hypothetical protein
MPKLVIIRPVWGALGEKVKYEKSSFFPSFFLGKTPHPNDSADAHHQYAKRFITQTINAFCESLLHQIIF